MRIESPEFDHFERIPRKYTEDGANISPPLRWADVPARTAEFALIMEDPDAPQKKPWVHWVLYHIPGAVRELPEGLRHEDRLSNGAIHGANSFGHNSLGYRGPAPPTGGGVHRYFFRLYALGEPLNFEGAVDRAALISALERATPLATAELVGTYDREGKARGNSGG